MAKSSPYNLISKPFTMYTQTEAMKETKDMSKNLVSGVFVGDYRDGVIEKPLHRRRQLCLSILLVLVGILAAWLVVLTAVREVQLTRLRQQVDELSADVLAMKITVKSLNQKFASKKLIGDFKTMDDTIYADIDQEGNIPVEDSKESSFSDLGETAQDSLEKLHDVTVLEGEDDDDDEDMYFGDDDEDTESGDWYPDYDKRNEKNGQTNMVRLKAEDFAGSVVLKADDKPLSKIRELKRMLNEDPQNPAVFAAAVGVDDVVTEDLNRAKRSVVSEAPEEFVDNFAAPRTFAKSDERRKGKKFKSSTIVEISQPVKTSTYVPTRLPRHSEDEITGQARPFIAAHFHGNTSHLNTEIHEHYKGNGLIRVSHDAAHDVWYPSPWTVSSPHPRPTLTRKGHVHVHHTGVYLVYVQIYYLDSHDVISWVLHRTNPETEGRDTLLQCAQFSPSSEPRDKPNSCFSASALFLRAGDKLAVRNTGGDRHSLMQPEKSFIGLIKLADADVADEEL